MVEMADGGNWLDTRVATDFRSRIPPTYGEAEGAVRESSGSNTINDRIHLSPFISSSFSSVSMVMECLNVDNF